VTAVLLCDCYPQYQHQSQCTIHHCGRLELRSSVGLWGSIRFFLFPLVLPSGASGFLLSSNHDWFACQLQRAEFLRKGSHKGPLFRVFPLSLQSIISNQMRPRRSRGAWFSRLLRHPARRLSGSILSPGTHTGTNKTSVHSAVFAGRRHVTDRMADNNILTDIHITLRDHRTQQAASDAFDTAQ